MLTINCQAEPEVYRYFGGGSKTTYRLVYFVADDLGERVFEIDAGGFALEEMAKANSILVGGRVANRALQACAQFCGRSKYSVEWANVGEQLEVYKRYQLNSLLSEN